jgi:hypothetical protein
MKKIIDMTKFLALTQNTIPRFLEKNSPIDMSSYRDRKRKKDRKYQYKVYFGQCGLIALIPA